jgi:hypothetical protein
MKPWMLPWLLPVGLLGAVVFVSIFNGNSPLAALTVALISCAIAAIVRHKQYGDADPDADVNYWRIRRR